MKITDYFEKSQGNTLVSFEVLPPLKGGSMSDIFNTLDPLMEFKPRLLMLLIIGKSLSIINARVDIMKNLPSENVREQSEFVPSIMHRYGIDAIIT